MIQAKTIVLGDYTYVVSHLPASAGLAAGARLTNALAPAFASLSKEATFDKAAAYLMSQPDLGGNLQFLANTFAKVTTVTGPGGTSSLGAEGLFDTHFAGRYSDLLKWLRASVEFDLADFLGALSGAIAEAKAAVLSGSTAPSPAPKTG